MDKFEEAFTKFLAAAQAKLDAHLAANRYRWTEVLSRVDGPKYVRVVRSTAGVEYSGSAYCFVEKATGNVLKAASWKAPAKGVRSNIYAEDHGMSGLTPYGAVYHR